MAAASSSLPGNLPILAWSELQVGQLIGQGGYSEVFRGQLNGKEIAIKQLLLKKLPEHLVKDFENETKIMAQVAKCLQIIRLIGVCMEEGHYAMVMEYMERGSLYQVLQDEKIDLPWPTLRLQIAIDIGKGLSYLHDREILHRDLKSLNILLDANFNAKITDFGLSRIKLETKSTSTLHKQSAGTVRWKAPELFKRGVHHSKASDVYSYGMILWEIASRKLPFSDADDDVTVMGWVTNGEQETIPPDAPSEYSKVITRAWSKEPDKRPSTQFIVLELEKLKPKPTAKSWHFDPETKSIADAMGKEYALIEASAKDIEKVKAFYAHHPVPGFEIGSVKVVYNPTFNRSFEAHLKKLQKRQGNPFFNPKWSLNMLDQNLHWRKRVAEMFEEMAKPYTDPDYPDVKLLPLWHGTNGKAIESICQVGYANPTATDAGFFGRGLYGAHEAAYPYRVYCKGAFFLNWMAIYSAYPVITGDQVKLEAKGNFENYDAHFIPVTPRDPSNPHEVNYDPCQPFGQHTYTEVVVFESAACLPRYLVELQATLKKTPVLAGPPKTAGHQGVIGKVAGSSAHPPSTSKPLSPEEEFQNGLRHFIGAGGKKDLSAAFKSFQSAAEKGHADAEFYLGMSFLWGSGCKIDNVMAVKYFKLAADQGHAIACMRLGRSYQEGWGVKKDQAVGDSYMQKAIEYKLIPSLQLKADRGDALGQTELGICHHMGTGVQKDGAMAVKYYKLAADQGYAPAQYNLGVFYERGIGVQKDEAMAVKYYKLATDQGNAPAQYNLGVRYEYGTGVQKDEAMAVKYYKPAADQGYALAQYGLGLCYEQGTGVQKDEALAVKYYKPAADQGNALAQHSLGWCYETGKGVQKDEAMAVKYYKLAVDQGYANAQHNLGVCYEHGKGVQKDEAMAVKYYKLAADQGYANAQYNLGWCYANGKGVQKDEAMAVKYYKLAADQGFAPAQHNLGVCYANGTGVQKDEAMAVKYYKLAADQGYANAQHNLGWCYQLGKGVKKDEALAVKYYKLAADQGYANAQHNLGWCYEYVKGVKKDMAMALKYYQLAADQGNVDAKAALTRLNS